MANEPTWVDVTPKGYAIRIIRGDTEARLTVPVSEATIDWIDPEGELFPLSPSLAVQRPGPGTYVRVSVVNPDGDFFPMFVGRMDEIIDDHAADGVRTATVRAYGIESELSTVLTTWDRANGEFAQTRLEAALTEAEWSWASWEGDWPLRDNGDAFQLRDVQSPSTTALAAIDNAANGAGWVADFKPDGTPRVNEYPLLPDDSELPIVAVDKKGEPDGYAASRIVYRHDFAETLNYVELTRPATPAGAGEQTVVREDEPSIAQVGQRSLALGFPVRDSSFYLQSDFYAFAERVLERYLDADVRVAALGVDSKTDPRWLDELYLLDRRKPILTKRLGLLPDYPLEVLGLVVGFEHLLTRNRWESVIHTTTVSVDG